MHIFTVMRTQPIVMELMLQNASYHSDLLKVQTFYVFLHSLSRSWNSITCIMKA